MDKIIESFGPDGRRKLRIFEWDDSLASHIKEDDWLAVDDDDLISLIPFQDKIKSILYSGEKNKLIQSFTSLEALHYWGASVDFRVYPCLKDIMTEPGKKYPLHYLNHPNVEKMQLERLDSKDLTFLNEATQLRSLGITLGSLQSLKGIEVMTQLRELKLKDLGRVIDIDDIAACRHLESVELTPVPKLKDISALYGLKKLRYLFVSSKLGEQESIDWLKDMPDLECAGIWVKAKRIDWDILANHPKLYDIVFYTSEVLEQPDNQELKTILESNGKKVRSISRQGRPYPYFHIEFEPHDPKLLTKPHYVYQKGLQYRACGKDKGQLILP